MGLDFSHTDAHWSYGGFNSFRERLARQLGFELREMEGFDGCTPWDSIVSKNDPIIPLLNHSDCDGVLTPAECINIYPRLIELVSDWPDGDYDKRQALMLAKGMKDAYEANEDLEFT